MKIHSIPVDSITISPNRQRREFNYDSIADLAGSIGQNGLISPIVVRKGEGGGRILVAGERRLKAIEYLWNLGEQLRCGDQDFVENEVPCLYLGDLDDIDAFEVELEENIRRVDLTWQERAEAISRLNELRTLQSEKRGEPPPSRVEIGKEAYPDVHNDSEKGRRVSKDLILARHLDDPEVYRARTADEGLKILIRKEETRKSAALGVEIGRYFSARDHTLLQGDCLDELKRLETRFDVILSDPPYGINAQSFNDSGGVGGSTGGHFYNDTPQEWRRLMEPAAALMFTVAKADAHAYLFCDIEMFDQLKIYMTMAGWKVFRTPLIWVNPSGMRAPWPDKGPQRKYQLILYALKGDRNVTKLAPDVITHTADPNLNHPAQKPVGLYVDLLRRSARPGDSVLDCFCGSGTIFPAGHLVQCKATGIENDPAAFGIAAKRLSELK